MISLKRTSVIVFLLLLAIPLFGQKFAVTNGSWNGNIWANSVNGVAGETTVPLLSDSVVIKSGVNVLIETLAAQCKGISFQDTSAHLSLASASRLNIYGDFTLASVNHKVFSGWEAGAKVRFAGDNIQIVRGFSTTAFSTSFNYLLIDKTGGKVTTDLSNERIGIGDTLEILNGTFELGSTDDMESRSSAGAATSFVLLVGPNGVFNMVGGASHIRRASNTGLETKRIGKAVIYGTASLRTTSTNGINFAGIDVEAGGELVAASFSNSAAGNFNSGKVTVKAAGELRVISTAPFWEPTTSSVDLLPGGILRSNAADQVNTFPPSFNNNGTVRYGSSADQTIKDMNYRRLELSFGGIKTWTVDTNRVITDSLEINNSALLRLTASSAKTITVNGTLRLTSGSINNADSNNVALTIADGGTISRATGSIDAPLQFNGGVNLRYTSSVQNTIPGNELPLDPAKLKKLMITGSQGITLGSNITVNDTLELTDGNIYLGNFNLTVGANGKLLGTPSDSSMIVPTGTGVLRKIFVAPASFLFALGDTLNGSRYTPGTVNFSSGTFTNASVDAMLKTVKHPNNISANNFINRYWILTPSGISGFSCDVAFTYHPTDVQGIESNIYLGRWTGTGWGTVLNKTDTVQHRLYGTVTSLSEFTGGETTGFTKVERSTTVPKEFALSQNFPNPFNPSTMIKFDVPVLSTVTLKIYDLIGKEITTLANGMQEAGTYTIQFNSSLYGLSSGIYFYKIEANNNSKHFVKVQKMMLVK